MQVTQKPLPVAKPVSHSISGTLTWLVVVGINYFLLLAILAGPHFLGHRIKAGDVAEQEISAPRKTLVVDEEKTKQRRELARQEVLPVLKRDPHKSSEIMNKLAALLDRIKRIQSESILQVSQASQLTAQEETSLLEMKPADFEQFVNAIVAGSTKCPIQEKAAQSAFNKIRSLPTTVSTSVKMKSRGKNDQPKSAQIFRDDFLARLSDAHKKYQELRAQGVSPGGHDLVLIAASVKPPESMQQYIADVSACVQKLLTKVSLQPYVDRTEWELQIFEFLPERLEQELRHLTAEAVASQLEPNVSVDQAATEAQVEKAVNAVKPTMKEIETGAVILRKGETVKPEDLDVLKSLDITQVSDPALASAIAIALFSAFLLFGLYLHTYEPKLFFSPSALALMATVSIITSVVAFFIGPQFPQFIPLSATTLILAVTYGRRLAGTLTVLILLFLSVSELLSGPHLVALGTAAGMALGASIKRRRDLMITGILVGFLQMVGYTSAVVIGGTPAQNMNLGIDLPMEMLGGLISAIAAIGSLPFLENIFGILTPYRIAELAEPDQPLMRQLEENAPGTYQHSLAVANLAEGGARAIGADVNLVHTGAMYHDIGKMVTPRYFIENQLGDKNPHDFIPPEESRAKVLAHVTNGLALAQKYGLPKAVQAFIPEHQGTTVMAYFYHKACMRDGTENVDPLYYRYPGPKPQTKESAIVMLADVSEAVTHSMHDPTMEEVESAISNVFKARWDDGQFSESGLTDDELERVKRGFVRVWRTLHHDRLKYPATTTGRMPVVPAEVAQGQSQSASGAVTETAGDKKASPGAASEWDC